MGPCLSEQGNKKFFVLSTPLSTTLLLLHLAILLLLLWFKVFLIIGASLTGLMEINDGHLHHHHQHDHGGDIMMMVMVFVTTSYCAVQFIME